MHEVFAITEFNDMSNICAVFEAEADADNFAEYMEEAHPGLEFCITRTRFNPDVWEDFL